MPERAIMMYDGECGFCDRSVQFVLKRDKRSAIRFAPLQGRYAHEKLTALGKNPDELSTMILVLDPETPHENVLTKARAALTALKLLGGLWTIPALLRFLPKGLLDWGYDLIARNRFRIAGRLDSCRLPTPAERARFILDD